MTKSIFITATNTDVGKTYISALIVKALRKKGLNCGYYKPVLSGAEIKDGRIIPGDCNYVFNKSGILENPCNYVSYIFKPAVSPHLAAQIEHQEIKLEKIKYDFKQISHKYEYLVIEGAGGITCPFNMGKKRILLPDIINELNQDIIIVSSSSLGSINSTLLTVEYAKLKGINVKGIIMNNYDEDNFMHIDNKKQIEILSGVQVIATVKTNENNIKNLSEFFKEV